MAVYAIQGQLQQDIGHSIYSEAIALHLLWDSYRVSSESWVVIGRTWVTRSDFLYGYRSTATPILLHYNPTEFSLARELPGTQFCFSGNLSVALILKRLFANEVAEASTRYRWWFDVDIVWMVFFLKVPFVFHFFSKLSALPPTF